MQQILAFVRDQFRLNNFLGQVTTYGLGSAGTQVLGFLLIPLYIRFLTAEHLGALALIELLINIGQITLGLGLPYAILRYVSLSQERAEGVIGTGIISCAAASFAGAGLLLTLSGWFVHYFGATYVKALRYAILIIPFSVLISVIENVWRIQLRVKLFAVFSFVKTFLMLLLTVGLVAYWNMGVEGVLLAQLYISILGVAMGLLFFREIIKSFDYAILRRMLRFGLPLIFHKLAKMANSSVDRLIVQHLAGLHALGIYNMACRIAGILDRIISPLSNAWVPFLFNELDSNHSYGKKNVCFAGYIYIVMVIISGIIVIYFGPLLIQHFDKSKEYTGSNMLIGILVLGAISICYYNIVSFGILLKEKTYVVLMISLASGIINILVNIILIPRIGVSGAAWATLLSNLSLFVLGHWLSNRFYKIPRGWSLSLGTSLIIFAILIL